MIYTDRLFIIAYVQLVLGWLFNLNLLASLTAIQLDLLNDLLKLIF